MLGEGSGCGLALAAILKIRNLGLGLPAAAVLISPCIDVSAADDSEYTAQSVISSSFTQSFVNEINTLKNFGRTWNTHSAPVYADFFKGFPSTLIQSSTEGPWLNDFFRLYHVLDVAGVQVRLDLYENMPQGFQFRNPDAPESRIARRKIQEFTRFWLTGEGHLSCPTKAPGASWKFQGSQKRILAEHVRSCSWKRTVKNCGRSPETNPGAHTWPHERTDVAPHHHPTVGLIYHRRARGYTGCPYRPAARLAGQCCQAILNAAPC